MAKPRLPDHGSETRTDISLGPLRAGSGWGKQLSEIMDSMPPSVFAGVLSPDGTVLYVNQASLSVISARLDDVRGQPFDETPWWQFSDSARMELRAAIAAAATGAASRFEFSMKDSAGKSLIYDFSIQPVIEGDGEIVYLAISASNVTERKQAEHMLCLTQFGVDHAYGAVFRIAASGRFLYVNHSGCELVGFSQEELLGLSVHDIDTRVTEPGWPQRWNDLKKQEAFRFESVYRRRDGTEIPVEGSASFLEYDGEEYSFVYVIDITQRKLNEERIRRLAFYDEVTGLPNRTLLRQELKNLLDAPGHIRHPIALMKIDLIHLRDVNFTFGQENGDLLLKEVGVRISRLLEGKELAARIGNAQFAVVLPDLATGSAPSRALQLLDALEAPFPVENITYELGARIGIALYPGHAPDAETLLRKADVALYQAKQSGQRHTTYRADQDPYQLARLEMIGRFRRAINEGQLQLYCQPKLNLQSKQIVGAEALVRWQHPDLGLVGPDQFVPLIESTDLIHFLTQFMLEAAVSQYYAWQRKGIHIPLAVNLSPRNLMEPDLVTNLQYLLTTWGAQPDWLGIEITEGTLLNDPLAAIEELHRLHKMGVRLFIDDFGTGYSSLSYLMRLPVDVIKIDHSFTMHMLNDKGAAAIVKSTIELAHNLGMSVVAEGAENEEICDALLTLGCDEAQGYFISPPIPADNLVEWLASSGYACASGPPPVH